MFEHLRSNCLSKQHIVSVGVGVSSFHIRSSSSLIETLYLCSGWWFGSFFIFPYILIIPIDFHIFQRGRSTTNQLFHGVTFKKAWPVIDLSYVGILGIPWA